MSYWDGLAPRGQHPLKHGLGFLFSGSLAFLTDATILTLLTLAGLHPIAARFFAIAIAMVVGWRCHRRFTFRLATPPRFKEFLRYAAVGWTVTTLNYGVFVLIILLRPSTLPFFALVASSGVSMVFAYLGMRFAAFRQNGRPHG